MVEFLSAFMYDVFTIRKKNSVHLLRENLLSLIRYLLQKIQ